jgi:ABC-type uncharacterized transport system involved in gliding motility auxiliary subunit
MRSHEAVMLLVCLVFAGIILGEYMTLTESKVYVCSEVTKDTPADVKKICEKAWRRYE